MARALRAWAINQGGKNSVRNLRYGPRTRLVRGISDSDYDFDDGSSLRENQPLVIACSRVVAENGRRQDEKRFSLRACRAVSSHSP